MKPGSSSTMTSLLSLLLALAGAGCSEEAEGGSALGDSVSNQQPGSGGDGTSGGGTTSTSNSESMAGVSMSGGGAASTTTGAGGVGTSTDLSTEDGLLLRPAPGDADGDTIGDEEEGSADADGDGVPDSRDLDSDGDGIPDAVEAGDSILATPAVDSDGDGTPDYLDEDSDGDGLFDVDESRDSWDTDGDLTPNYLDLDSDNDDLSDSEEVELGLSPVSNDSDGDFISDGDEGIEDPDDDGVINALDEDSDGDGFSDAEESGDRHTGTPPVDSDFDGVVDYLDLDSDQDGLPDQQEANCVAGGVSGRLALDADADGYSDLAEQLLGSDPCDARSTVLDTGVEFFFVLPYAGDPQSSTLRFVPTVKRADVFFNVDTTSSMGGEIDTLKAGLSTIVDSTEARVSDVAFGVASFEDFPLSPNGSSTDEPFTLLSGVTEDTAEATLAVNALALGSGGDGPESGFEALYQVAVGDGVDGSAGAWGPFTTGGRFGGAQFRPEALPIVVHVTDATAHDTDYPLEYNSHGSAEALPALQEIGARVITVESGASATAQLQQISQDTGALVPACAFKTNATEWRCGVDTCCDGTLPSGDECILRYAIQATGAGLTEATVDGIDALIKYTTFDVVADARDDGDPSTPVTSDFLERVEANEPDNSFRPPNEPEFSCNPVPDPAEFDDVGYNNGFEGFAVGSSNEDIEGAKLFFTVVAQNNLVEETDTPQLFNAFIDIVDEKTGTVLDTQDVVVIVPANPGGAGE